MQKTGGILGRRCQRLLLQLLLHLSKGLLIQEENKYWLQYSYFFILLDPLNRAVQGYRQHFAHKAGLIVCQGQLFSLLRRNSLLCPCQNRAPFVTKNHSISMSDVPRIRKKSLKVSHHSATPEAFWIKHAFATSSVCKAKKKRRAFSKFLVVLCFLFLNITPLVSTHILAVSTQEQVCKCLSIFPTNLFCCNADEELERSKEDKASKR